jgi:uncharacterized protein (UPF0261 family)
MRKYLAVAALIAAGLAHGANLTYDPMARHKAAALDSLVFQTVICMRGAVAARLAGGERNDNAIASWVAQTCGVPLGRFMVSDMGFSETDAATYLFAMGHAAINDTPGVRRGR